MRVTVVNGIGQNLVGLNRRKNRSKGQKETVNVLWVGKTRISQRCSPRISPSHRRAVRSRDQTHARNKGKLSKIVLRHGKRKQPSRLSTASYSPI